MGPDDEEAASPVPNVMDNSGALSSGGPDPTSRGVVRMPDSEALRRSMAAEHERQAALAKGSLPGPGVEKAPVSATSSGLFVWLSFCMSVFLYVCLSVWPSVCMSVCL